MKVIFCILLLSSAAVAADRTKTPVNQSEVRTMNDVQEEVDEQLDTTPAVEKRAIRRNLRTNGETDLDKIPPTQRRDGKNL